MTQKLAPARTGMCERVKIQGNWEEAMKKALKAPPQRKQK
jgi:hypothetical protein